MVGYRNLFASLCCWCVILVLIGCWLAAVTLYALLGGIFDGPGTVVTSLAGIAISPHFDQPYLSTSLTDFWR